MLDAEKAVEDFSQRADMMQIVKHDDGRQLGRAVFTLLGNVRQVLTQLLARLVINVECRNAASARLFPIPASSHTFFDYYYYYYFFRPQVVKIPGVKNYKS